MSEENTTTTAAAAALRRTARIYQGQEEDVYRLYSKLVPPLFLLWTVQCPSPLYSVIFFSLHVC